VNTRYHTEIVKEKLQTEPALLEGETVEFKATCALSFFHWIAVIILTFVPPFLWGIGLLFMLRYRKKHSGVWVTNKRLIDFNKNPLKGLYRVTSIPLAEITKIRKGRLTGTFGDVVIDLFNRMLGISDVSIYTQGHVRPRHGLSDIKGAGALIKHVQRSIPNVS
jgi:hypothetical protein